MKDFPKCRWHQKKKVQHAVLIGTGWANSMFEDFFEHPEFRGLGFQWSKFPEVVKRLATVSAFMSFPGECKYEIYDLAGQTAFERATVLIKENNLT